MREMLNKYKSLNVVTKATLWFTLCGIIQKGISFFTVPVFTRLMSSSQYGQVTVYQSWSSTIAVFATLNLAAGVYNTGLIKYEDDRDRFTSSLQGLSTTVTLILAIIIILCHNIVSSVTGLGLFLLCVMMLEMVIEPTFGFWAARNRFEYRYVRLVGITLLIAILNPLVGLVAVYFSTEKGLARILSIAAVSLIVYSGIYIDIFKKGRKFYYREYWSYALKFNIPLLPHYLSNTILNQADRIMIANICSESFAGMYSVAYSCSMAINIVTNSIHNAIVPWIYENLKNRRYFVINKRVTGILVVVCMVILSVISISPEIIKIMAPSEYYQAVWIIPPVTASVYFMFLQSMYCNVEFYYEKNIYIMVASVSGAIFNVVLNYIFISKYGFLAAGYTTLICYILYCVAHGIFVNVIKKNKGINEDIYNNRKIIVISTVFLAIVFFMTVIFELYVVRYIVLLVIAVLLMLNRKRVMAIIKGNSDG